MDYCSSCEQEFVEAELLDVSDPFTGEVLWYYCEDCNEAACERTQEFLHG